MSQYKNKFNAQNVLASVAAEVPLNVPVPPVVHPEPTGSVEDQLKALQLKKLQKEVGQEEEAERIQKEARRQTALNLEKARQEKVQIQRLCPHQKPNGQPAIGGQRDHQHTYHFICAYCQKEFTQHDLPAHLRIPLERVGGPNN